MDPGFIETYAALGVGEDSWLYPFTAHLAPAIANWAGQLIPFFREIFREF